MRQCTRCGGSALRDYAYVCELPGRDPAWLAVSHRQGGDGWDGECWTHPDEWQRWGKGSTREAAVAMWAESVMAGAPPTC